MKTKFTAIALLIFVLSSCSKFLDTNPKDTILPENYYNTEAQLNMSLAGVYNTLTSYDVYGSAMIARMGLDANEGYYRVNITTAGVSNNDIWPTDLVISAFWKTLYEGINKANALLANINKPVMDESKRSIIRGQALFLRAYFHFLLVSNFGDVPLKLTETTSPEAIYYTRTPAKQVYEQIIADMTEAEGLVPVITAIGYGGKISKSAVQGILARVCLYMTGKPINDTTKWNDVLFWTNKVIASGIHSLNPSYQQVFINYAKDIYDIRESIWEVEFYNPSATDPSRLAGRIGINLTINSNNTVSGYGQGLIYATATAFRKYVSYHKLVGAVDTEYSPDLRRDWAIAPFSYNPAGSDTRVYWANKYPLPVENVLSHRRFPGKWRREYEPQQPKTNDASGQNFAVLRYSDVLLMFAEALNELQGPNGTYNGMSVYSAINQVKRRGYGFGPLEAGKVDDQGNPVDETGHSQLTMREYIRDERSRELNYECLRKKDLLRWGIYVDTMHETGALLLAEAPVYTEDLVRYFTNVRSRDIVFPIPSYEIGLGRGMKQNFGW